MNAAASLLCDLAADIADAIKATAVTTAVLADRASMNLRAKAGAFDIAHRLATRETPR